jgi:hypothetical protein
MCQVVGLRIGFGAARNGGATKDRELTVPSHPDYQLDTGAIYHIKDSDQPTSEASPSISIIAGGAAHNASRARRKAAYASAYGDGLSALGSWRALTFLIAAEAEFRSVCNPCYSAWGSNADRRGKPLKLLGMEGQSSELLHNRLLANEYRTRAHAFFAWSDIAAARLAA